MPVRLFLLVCAVALFAVGERRTKAVSRAFDRPASPFTLALARIAVFGALVVHAPSPVFAVACALGLVGLFTRVSAWTVVALGVGAGEAGRPLLWAAALLAATPCADVLAFDAVPDAWRRGDAGDTAPPAPSPVYGAPLRMLGLFAALALLAEPPRWSLLILILAPLDGAKALRWLGRTMFRRPLAIVNDGDCGFCRRAIATLRTLDVLERIGWTSSLDSAAVRTLGLTAVADGADLEHFTAVSPDGTVLGYDAYWRLAKRIPLFWPALPILALPPVVALGRATYAKVEASRPDINPEPLAPKTPPTRVGVALVGAGVLALVAAHLVRGL